MPQLECEYNEGEYSGGTPDDNPGATIMWFGKYKDRRLDEVDMGYRDWVVRTAAPGDGNLDRVKKLLEKLAEWEYERDGPGATIMWFGRGIGKRLDHLDEYYCRTLVLYSHKDPTDDGLAFRELYKKYLDWLDERRNPLLAKIWFGIYEGYEIILLYTDTHLWNWLLHHGGEWRDQLEDMHERYVAWKAKHPRECFNIPAWAPRKTDDTVAIKLTRQGGRLGSTLDDEFDSQDKELESQDAKVPVASAQRRGRGPDRGPRTISNPVGKKLGPEDDGVASDADESYQLDDFVVSDSDSSTGGEDPEDDTEGLEDDTEDHTDGGDQGDGLTYDELLEDPKEEKAAVTKETRHTQRQRSLRQSGDKFVAGDTGDPFTQTASGDQCESQKPSEGEDTDGSLPSLAEIFKTPSKPSPNKRRLVRRSQARRPPPTDDDSDTEVKEVPPPPVFRRETASTSRSPQKRRKPPIEASGSGSDSDTPLCSPAKKAKVQERSQQRTSPSPFADGGDDEDDEDEDIPAFTPRKSRRGRRLFTESP